MSTGPGEMRRVQIESPFAPRMPSLVMSCIHDVPCKIAARRGFEGVQPCGNCMSVIECERIRGHEKRDHARYLAACIRDCLARGETPYASHWMLMQALDDNTPAERERGIEAGFAMRRGMHLTAIYVDCYADEWWSPGMLRGEADARSTEGHVVEIRRIGREQVAGK